MVRVLPDISRALRMRATNDVCAMYSIRIQVDVHRCPTHVKFHLVGKGGPPILPPIPECNHITTSCHCRSCHQGGRHCQCPLACRTRRKVSGPLCMSTINKCIPNTKPYIRAPAAPIESEARSSSRRAPPRVSTAGRPSRDQPP